MALARWQPRRLAVVLAVLVLCEHVAARKLISREGEGRETSLMQMQKASTEVSDANEQSHGSETSHANAMSDSSEQSETADSHFFKMKKKWKIKTFTPFIPSFTPCYGSNSYRSGTSCRTCESNCGTANYRSGCGHGSHGSCRSCSNKLSGSSYTGTGGQRNDCPYLCAANTYKHTSWRTRSCKACSTCSYGQWRRDCGGTSAGQCVACSNVPPSNGQFDAPVAGGGASCPWHCMSGFYMVGQSCRACNSCPVGQYTQNCGGVSAGQCTSCTKKPATATYTASGGLQDVCAWSCPAGTYKHGNTCTTCATCATGQWRSGCGGTTAGQCLACSDAPSQGVYTSDGGAADACEWTCKSSWFKSKGACSQCTACATGQFRKDCKGVLSGACAVCSGLPLKALFIADGGITDSCAWECSKGSFRQGDACTTCGACPAEHVRNACTGTEPGACAKCANKPPSSAHLTVLTVGSQDGFCDWECNKGWTLDGVSSCKECPMCAVGQWRASCEHAAVLCAACTNHLPEHARFSAHGGATNDCPWVCLEGFHERNGKCVACPLCAVGEYRKECRDSNSGKCDVCTNELQPNSHYTSHGGIQNSCPSACDDTYFVPSGSTTCARCEACGLGNFRKGCGASSSGECAACTNVLPPHSHHSEDMAFSASCPWECDEGFYKLGGECLACDSCSVGAWRQGCGIDSPGVCTDCTVPLPTHSHYTTHGNRTDSCKWGCDAVFYKDEDTCLLCAIVSKTCPTVPTDCEVSKWGEWTHCDKTCGGGKSTRTRQVIRQKSNYGVSCPPLEEVQPCNAAACSGDSWVASEVDKPCTSDALRQVDGFKTVSECTSMCDLDTECTGQVAFGSGDKCTSDTDGVMSCSCSLLLGDCATTDAATSAVAAGQTGQTGLAMTEIGASTSSGSKTWLFTRVAGVGGSKLLRNSGSASIAPNGHVAEGILRRGLP